MKVDKESETQSRLTHMKVEDLQAYFLTSALAQALRVKVYGGEIAIYTRDCVLV